MYIENKIIYVKYNKNRLILDFSYEYNFLCKVRIEFLKFENEVSFLSLHILAIYPFAQ